MTKSSDDQLPAEITRSNRLLTAAAFRRLADAPPEVEWFANQARDGIRYEDPTGSIRLRSKSDRQASRRSLIAARNPMHQGPARTVPSSVRSKIGA
jgi:hypothetical protein